MELTLIRNATLKIKYGGRTLLIDPYFAPRHSLPSLAGRSPNPLVDLPLEPAAIVAGVDLVLVSHLHTDHFDRAAQSVLPADIPLFCRPGDEPRIQDLGFRMVTPLDAPFKLGDLSISATPGRHGSSPEILTMMGDVCGFTLRAPLEPVVYWAGDTVWYEEMAATIDLVRPDVIITHSGGAIWGPERELIIMDAAQTAAVSRAAPEAAVVAVHVEALDHCLTSREELRALNPAVHVPADGDRMTFS